VRFAYYLSTFSFISVAFVTATLRVFVAHFPSGLASARFLLPPPLPLGIISSRPIPQLTLSIDAVVTTTLIAFLANAASALTNTALLGRVLGLGFALSSR
jgi:hypothetical protein